MKTDDVSTVGIMVKAYDHECGVNFLTSGRVKQ